MTKSNAPTVFWIISGIALLWNLMGVGAFIGDLLITPEAIAELDPFQQDMYNNNPMWMKIIYGVATIFGLLGAISLLLRKSWATPLFAISLVAVLVQMLYTILGTSLVENMGIASIAFPIIVILIAAYLLYYARKAQANGWIS